MQQNKAGKLQNLIFLTETITLASDPVEDLVLYISRISLKESLMNLHVTYKTRNHNFKFITHI